MAEWVLICDGDQLLSADPAPLLQSTKCNAWSFPLYDIWNDRSLYRDDAYWRGHEFPRPWLFAPHRVPEGYVAAWSGRGIHTGHTPANFPIHTGLAPAGYYWTHLGYLSAEDRQTKLTRYRSQYHQMTDFEQAHAESIADPNPTLRILPFAKPIRILCGGPVRKRAEILEAHLATLAEQELPTRVSVDFCFVDDYPAPDPAQAVLADFVAAHGGKVLKSHNPAQDFSDQHPVTHQWSVTAMARMGQLKTMLMQECLAGQYDFLWLVDSDLLMDRTTLTSLLSAQRDIVAAVYWTRWNTDPRICAGPQVWLKPPYQLALPHYPEHEFRHALGVERALERVAGLGACTLIRRGVIEKGVGFSKPADFPSGGLMDGEDRHFCEWARRLHVDLWADGWPDIFHVYHPQQVETIPNMLARVRDAHPTFCNHGHLVSLKLLNVDDGIGPMHLRCRIGDGSLLPEVEQAIMNLQRGETTIKRIHFPMTTKPVGGLALGGQARLIRIELVDCKPFGLPPVLEDEFYTTPSTVQDKTHLTDAQHAQIAEVAQ